MTRILQLVLFVIAIAFCTSTTRADDGDVISGMGERAVRGLINTVTGIVELPVQISKGFNNGCDKIENEVGSKTVGTICGIFRGATHAAGRTGSGIIELAGFWAASPEDNDGVGIELDAELAWEEGEQHSIFEPSLGEGIKPVCDKLVRGLGNGIGAIAELPGQIREGVADGNVVIGVVEGVWFTASRAVYGFGEVVTFLLPNPPDNKGSSFDAEFAWTKLFE